MTQAQYDALVEHVEDLDAKVKKLMEQMTAVQERNAELERAASSTRAELTAEVDTTRAELTAERESRHRAARALRRVVEEHDLATSPAPLPLGGGSGGRSGQSVYTSPNGVVVTSSHPTYSNRNLYYMEYLFNGTHSGTHTDYWLVGATQQASLEFVLPFPMNINQIRLRTHGTHADRGIEAFTLTLAHGSEAVEPPVNMDALPRGEWIEVPLDHGLITSFTFDFSTTTTYVAVTAIEVYVNPHSALLSTVNGLLPFLAHDLGDNGGEGASEPLAR